MKIHINSKPGLYEVENYGRNTITLSTKHSVFQVPTTDFKSFAGGIWNGSISKDEMDTFLSVIQPERYRIQVQQENEILTLATRLEILEKIKMESQLEMVQPQVIYDEDDYEDVTFDETPSNQYEKWWREECDKNRSLGNKMRSIAKQVYSQTLDCTNFQITEGIKFIIQQNHRDDSYRFCWDPYGFVSNGHSDISSIYRENDWGTVNGGWIKIIEDDVILYAKSGDYGVYDDAIATECAKKVFPTKNIHSFAGRQWDNELDNMFYELPF